MQWFETILNGLMLGGLYGLIGLGLALVFGVMRVINIAHGEFIIAAAYAGVFLSEYFTDLSPLMLLPIVGLIAFAVGYVIQAFALNAVVLTGDVMRVMMLTFGLSAVMRNLMAEGFGTDPRSLPADALLQAGFEVAGLRIGLFPLLMLVLAIVLFMSLHWVLAKTQFGRIVRAASDNPTTVRLMGVRPARVYSVVMGISLAFAALAGLLLSMRSNFTPFSGIERLLLSYEVVIIGGLGSIWGALLGGMALGIAQLIGLKLDPNSGALYSHILFLLILLVKPSGIAGSKP
jgi:branched-chain amino acid transport system permease protein